MFSHCVVSDCFMTLWTVARQAPSVHGISQARILEWVAISFSKGSSRPWDQTHVSCIGRWILSTEPTGKPKRIQTESHIKHTEYLRFPNISFSELMDCDKLTGNIRYHVSLCSQHTDTRKSRCIAHTHTSRYTSYNSVKNHLWSESEVAQLCLTLWPHGL